MDWLAKRKRRLFPVGPYRTDTLFAELGNFAELRPVPLPPEEQTFQGEAVYDAGEIELFGMSWDVVLSTVADRIYKISMYRSSSDKRIARFYFEDVAEGCSKICGKPSETKADLRLWALEDGYVVLKSNSAIDGESEYFVDLFLTSRESRKYPLFQPREQSQASEGEANVAVDTEADSSNETDTSEIPPAPEILPATEIPPAPEISDKNYASNDVSDEPVDLNNESADRLRVILDQIEGEIGESPVHVADDGRTLLHPKLAEELRRHENAWMDEALRDFLQRSAR